MKKEYISPEIEMQKFTIFCDDLVSNPISPDPDDGGGNDFEF